MQNWTPAAIHGGHPWRFDLAVVYAKRKLQAQSAKHFGQASMRIFGISSQF
jgi:hypothetical protein